jgi:hypothetical protein
MPNEILDRLEPLFEWILFDNERYIVGRRIHFVLLLRTTLRRQSMAGE